MEKYIKVSTVVDFRAIGAERFGGEIEARRVTVNRRNKSDRIIVEFRANNDDEVFKYIKWCQKNGKKFNIAIKELGVIPRPETIRTLAPVQWPRSDCKELRREEFKNVEVSEIYSTCNPTDSASITITITSKDLEPVDEVSKRLSKYFTDPAKSGEVIMDGSLVDVVK